MKVSKVLQCALLVSCLASPAFSQQRTIQFLTSDTDPEYGPYFQQAAKLFAESHPGVNVEIETQTLNSRTQKINNHLNAKTAPDLIKILPDETYTWATKGFLTPLDDVISNIGEQNFVENAITKIDGKVYAVPYILNNFGVLFYRSDLFEAAGLKPPTTWDELLTAAKALTKNGKYGIVFPAAMARATAIQFSQYMWSAGDTYFDKDLNVTFGRDGTVKALKMIKELARYAPPGVGSYANNEIMDAFLSGRAAMVIYSPHVIYRMNRDAKQLMNVTKAMPFPKGPVASVQYVSTNSYAIPSEKVGGDQIGLAKEFLKFLMSKDEQRKFQLARGAADVPPLKSLVSESDMMSKGALAGRSDIASVGDNLSQTLEFDREAGAIFDASGKVVRANPVIINPYMAAVIGRNVPAQVVQKVLLENASPEDAPAWGADQIKDIVEEIKAN
jgi:multiple sugar transport system substrate-binding protein